jgi:hypothetical protein
MPSQRTKSTKSKSSRSQTKMITSGHSWLVLKRSPYMSLMMLGFVVLFVSAGAYIIYNSTRAASQPELSSGIANTGVDCLDASGGLTVKSCDGQPTQNFSYNSNKELVLDGGCLVPSNAGAKTGNANARVVVTSCGSTTPWGGAWAYTTGGEFENQHADGLGGGPWCLDLSGSTVNGEILQYHCTFGHNEQWHQTTYSSGGGGGGGGCGSGYEASPSTAQCIANGMMSSFGMNPNAIYYVPKGQYNVGQWANAYGYMHNWTCLLDLWTQESGWVWNNSPLGLGNTNEAYGIPQADPGSKMASVGSDWVTNATTQIKWGLGYIQSVYGQPCSAWANEMTIHSYVIPVLVASPSPLP